MLDLYNFKIMKKLKLMLIFILVGLVTFSVGLWLYSTKASLSSWEYAVAALVAIVVIFSLIIGVRKLKDSKQGFPTDDELSIKIKQKAAANAFVYSFYVWLMIMFFLNDEKLSPSVPVGIGIMGMGLLFIGFWIYYSKVGITKETDKQ